MCFPEIQLKKSPIALAFFLQAGTEKKGLENDAWKTHSKSISGATAAIEVDEPNAETHFN